MGWMFQPKGRKIGDIIRASVGGEIVASAIYLHEAYLATKDEAGRVRGVVVLIKRTRAEIGIKIIGEDMGPLYYRAPARILDALTPANCNYSAEWRARCRAALQAAEGVKADLTGKRLKIFDRIFLVTGRHHARRRSWSAVSESTGQMYYIPPGLLKQAEIVE